MFVHDILRVSKQVNYHSIHTATISRPNLRSFYIFSIFFQIFQSFFLFICTSKITPYMHPNFQTVDTSIHWYCLIVQE